MPDGSAGFAPRTPEEAAILQKPRDEGQRLRWLKLRSRLGRVLNLGRSPFGLTLFLDDDTYACPAPGARAALRGALQRLARRTGNWRAYDIRAHVFARRRREKIALRDACSGVT